MTDHQGPGTDYRAYARELATMAVDGVHGRIESDPYYQRVTEGRDVGAMQKSYSSCGDLPHWLLFRLGICTPEINRKEHRGWRVGMNIAMLERIPVVKNVTLESRFETGDIIRMGDTNATTHVCVVLDHIADDLVTADYGQPGGKMRQRKIIHQHGKLAVLGSTVRPIMTWIPLLDTIDNADERGLLVPMNLDGWLELAANDQVGGGS